MIPLQDIQQTPRLLQENTEALLQTLKLPEKLDVFLQQNAVNQDTSIETLNEFQKIVDQEISQCRETNEYIKAVALTQFAATHITFDRSSMKDLKKEVERKTALQTDKRFGAHFHGFGGSIVKSGNIRVDTREDNYWFQFKINYFVREELEKTLIDFKQIDTENLHISIDPITKNFGITEVSVHSIVYRDAEKNVIAEVHIGNDKENGAFYNNIEVKIPEALDDKVMLQALYTSLTFLGIGISVVPQTEEDDQRLKITKLFQLYAPKESSEKRNSRDFHLLKPEDMKKECEKQKETIQTIFQKYLVENKNLMTKTESYPERLHWSVSDLADQMRENQAYSLITKVTGESSELINRTVNILKTGLVSTEDRFRSGINLGGISSKADLELGGGGHVFTRVIISSSLENMIEESGPLNILINLDVLNQGGYSYKNDKWGVKQPYANKYAEYVQRSTLIDFPKTLNSGDIFNEVMVPHCIPLQQITNVIGSDPWIKALKKSCSENNLIQDDHINGHHINDFFLARSEYLKKFKK